MNFLNTLANLYSNKNFAVAFIKGQFSLLNRTFATIVAGDASAAPVNVDLRLKTSFQIAGRKKRVALDDTANDYSGYNKKFINDAGMYMPDAAINEFAATDFGKRVITKDIEAKLASLVSRDYHVAFLYNMLISWGRAMLYKSDGEINRDEDGYHILKVKVNNYSDSHVLMSGMYPDDHTIEIPLDTPFSEMNLAPHVRTAENYFNHSYVMHYDASTPAKETFYLLHACGRDQTSALNFDIPIPTFQIADAAVDRINAHDNAIRIDQSNIPYHKPEILWDWIIDYVRINRLEDQFASTMELFSAMSFQPDPSTAEASVWLKTELVAVLSPFSPTRARIRVNLTDEPYNPSPETAAFVFDSSLQASNFFVEAAMYNYLMWYGLYALLHDEARNRSDWRSVFTSVSDHLHNLTTPEMRAFCIANVTGQQIPTYMTTGCGFYVDLSMMDDARAMPISVDKEGRYPNMSIPINAIYAPVSGSLLLGALAGELEVVQHLKSNFSFTGMGIGSYAYPEEELLKLVSIYRLAGNEVVLRNDRTDQRIIPYANVSECVIEPASVFFDPLSRDIWIPHSSDPRQGRSFPLPEVNNILNHSKISISIQRPTIEPIQYRTAMSPLRTFVQPVQRGRKKLIGIVSSKYIARPMTFKARPAPEYKEQDFHMVLPHLPPAKPEVKRVEAVEQHLQPAPTAVPTPIAASVPTAGSSSFANASALVPPSTETAAISTGRGEMIT
uniref:Major coat protein L-A virus domain-containing protein n=1 Tax=Uromyces totivirus D TaxID=2592705 RepID=A0A7G3KGA6_9VIRU|nr:hypothetical protein [Uromyces totivirus D]